MPERYANNPYKLTQTEASSSTTRTYSVFTSAKTGTGVSELFGYVARRAVMCWEWEEKVVHVYVPNFCW